MQELAYITSIIILCGVSNTEERCLHLKFVTVTPAKYKKDYPYLKEVDSLVLANKQMDLQSDRGRYFVKVDKWFPSSQICHCCGTKHPEKKELSI